MLVKHSSRNRLINGWCVVHWLFTLVYFNIINSWFDRFAMHDQLFRLSRVTSLGRKKPSSQTEVSIFLAMTSGLSKH